MKDIPTLAFPSHQTSLHAVPGRVHTDPARRRPAPPDPGLDPDTGPGASRGAGPRPGAGRGRVRARRAHPWSLSPTSEYLRAIREADIAVRKAVARRLVLRHTVRLVNA